MKKLTLLGNIVLATVLSMGMASAEESIQTGAISQGTGTLMESFTKDHNGVDLAYKAGTKMTSPMDGYVAVMDCSGDTCYVIITNDEVGDSVVFLNLKSTTVETGKVVKVGDVIGIAGNDPVHVGYYPSGLGSGRAVNPLGFLTLNHSKIKF